MLAATRRLARLTVHGAIREMHVDSHHVTVTGSANRDGRVLYYLDLPRQLDAATVGNRFLGELVHEDVAFEQKGGDAIGQVELRRREPLRLVGPADVIGRHARAMHHDAGELVEGERPPLADVADGVERGVSAADA